MNKSIIKKLGEKEMDRKDFLKYSGLVLVGIVGLKGVISLFSQNDTQPANLSAQQSSRGFGGGKYGA